jgi:predicted HTH domain antitoxin
MPTISIDLPDSVLSALRISLDEAAAELRFAAAVHWYSKGKLSQELAAQVAGLDRPDFLRALAKAGVPVFQIDPDELRNEALRD